MENTTDGARQKRLKIFFDLMLKEEMDNTLNTQDDIESSRDCPEEFIRKRAKAMDELMSKYISEVSKKLDSV